MNQKENNQTEYFFSNEEVHNIFDKIFKKCITLSAKAVVRMINGIFGTDYPDDSTLVYNWTEFVKDDKKISNVLADCIVTVNGEHSYHMEAQTYVDNEVVFRVFDYGFAHAKRNAKEERNRYTMKFPSPVIIYLYYESEVPDEYVIELEFDEEQNDVDYKVPVIKLPGMTSQEMDKRNMVILVPFKLLKLREWVDKNKKVMTKTPEELKYFIENDIIGIIESNMIVGNITSTDAARLKKYTLLLRDYICSHIGADGLEEVRGMTDHSFMTDIDILCEEYDNKIEALQKDNAGLQKDNADLQRNNSDLKEKLKAYEKLYGTL